MFFPPKNVSHSCELITGESTQENWYIKTYFYSQILALGKASKFRHRFFSDHRKPASGSKKSKYFQGMQDSWSWSQWNANFYRQNAYRPCSGKALNPSYSQRNIEFLDILWGKIMLAVKIWILPLTLQSITLMCLETVEKSWGLVMLY